jgi:eukaryotic-like serine/threonine-protein kinase
MAEYVGRYTVCGSMGSGGQGLILYGRLTGPAGFSRMVALKRVRPDLNSTNAKAMLLDEARLASRVVHPNVVQTLDVVLHEEELVLVMELVMGQSLAYLTKEQTMLPWPIATAIVAGALRGVHAAHHAVDVDGSALALVHRDLSPHNIIVDIYGVPKVLDFGIAKAVGRSQQNTDQGILKGRLAYMAPEYIHGTNSDRRSDIWAMGVVLWECLAGRRLFASTSGTIMGAVLTQPIPSLLDRGVPPALDEIVQHALQRDVKARFQSAADMASALDALGPAAPADVGRWVSLTAESTLTNMQNRLREIEAEDGPRKPLDWQDEPATTPGGVPQWQVAAPAASKPKPRRPTSPSGSAVVAAPKKWLRFAVPGATLAVGLLFGHLLTPQPSPDMFVDEMEADVSPSRLDEADDEPMTDGGVAFIDDTITVESPTALVAGAQPVDQPAAEKPPATPRRIAKPNCKPPYVEIDGVKRWKRQCF